ncbi:MAG: outer membrane beta-barrel protein [Acidobacteriaceae bacterium]|nr:outer membrane beta-barrel protein [Acidobacteriaceae bacterium]
MRQIIKLSFTFLALLAVATVTSSAQTEKHHLIDTHVGVIAGAAAGNYNLNETDGTSYLNLDSAFSGGRVGVHGGVDFNLHGLVVGALADWSWSNAHFKFNESSNTGLLDGLQSKIKQMTTVRGRVGRRYHRALPYVHGGLLVADTEFKVTGAISSGTGVYSQSKVHNGYVAGAGLEYALAHHVSFVTEYGYNHVGNIAVPEVLFTATNGVSSTQTVNFSTVTAGVNYHF